MNLNMIIIIFALIGTTQLTHRSNNNNYLNLPFYSHTSAPIHVHVHTIHLNFKFNVNFCAQDSTSVYHIYAKLSQMLFCCWQPYNDVLEHYNITYVNVRLYIIVHFIQMCVTIESNISGLMILCALCLFYFYFFWNIT